MMAISGVTTNVSFGGFAADRSPHIWIENRRHAPLDRAGVVLPDPNGQLFKSIKNNDAVSIEYGYRSQFTATWQGTVSWTKSISRDQIEIGATGVSKPLTTTKIKQSFLNDTPETIVKYAVAQSGLAVGQIDAPGMVFPRYTASTIPVWQMAKQAELTCQRSFNKNMSGWALWLGAGGVNWGDFDEPGSSPAIETGGTLIRHAPVSNIGGLMVIETFLLPGYMHSRLFDLLDSRRGVSGSFRALRVRHDIQESAARTFICYGKENSQF